MPRRDKRLQKAINNPKNVTFDELCQIFRDHGFVIDSGRGKGSHVLARLPGTPLKMTIPRQKPMRRNYVKQALGILDEAYSLGYLEED